MVDPRWEEVKSIAGRASELVGRERDEFLRAACRGDASLEAEIRSLVEAADVDDSFLEGAPPAEAPRRHELGEFRLLRELGRGASSIVYLARQERLNREVAVKVLVEGPLTSRTQVERFHREARAVARLRHPGIVRVLSDGQVDGTHWFAMEFVAGHDLARELELQRGGGAELLPPRGSVGYFAAVARLCAEAAEALHHAHQQGLVHRDVKPQNLLLDPRGSVQVVDFGLAHELTRERNAEELTHTGDLLGTLVYMSPEQAQAEGPVDHRTDVYSLGVVLYELCTHRRPIEGRSWAELIRRLQNDEPVRPRAHDPSIPPDLETICRTALAKEPERRYADAAALAEDLRRFLRDEPILARPAGWLTRLRRSARRHRLGLLTGGVLAASALPLFRSGLVHAETVGRLSVDLADGAGQQLVCPLLVRRIDAITSMPGPATALGPSPLVGYELPAGYYRVVVDCPTHGRRELTREILPDLETRVLQRMHPGWGTAGMIPIAGGTLALRDELAPLLALNGRDIAIEPFLADRCEVTVGEYERYLTESGAAPPPEWERLRAAARPDLPMVYVTWREAQAFAEWSGKRLPTFAEWTWMARGAEGRLYPWGSDRPVRGNVTYPQESDVDGVEAYLRKAMPVGSFPEAATPEGVQDLFGNVAEWTDSPLAHATEEGMAIRMEVRIQAGHGWDAATVGIGHTLSTFGFMGLSRADAGPKAGFRCVVSQ